MALRKGYYKRDLLARRLDKGQICFLGWSGEDLVHARWMFSGTFYVPYLRRRIALGPNARDLFFRPLMVGILQRLGLFTPTDTRDRSVCGP